MKIMVWELEASGLSQSFTPSKNTIVEAVRPHIYRHNFPTGTLKIEIYDSEDALVAESESIDIADIGSAAFFHGYVRFYIDAYLAADETYTFKLVGEDGYSFSEPAYCGWVNSVDLNKYPMGFSPANHAEYPLDLEIWERKVR